MIRRQDLIKNAPTEPEAFLRWAEQLRREEGRFELSRGLVTCNTVYASNFHSRVMAMAAIFRGIPDAPPAS